MRGLPQDPQRGQPTECQGLLGPESRRGPLPASPSCRSKVIVFFLGKSKGHTLLFLGGEGAVLTLSLLSRPAQERGQVPAGELTRAACPSPRMQGAQLTLGEKVHTLAPTWASSHWDASQYLRLEWDWGGEAPRTATRKRLSLREGSSGKEGKPPLFVRKHSPPAQGWGPKGGRGGSVTASGSLNL